MEQEIINKYTDEILYNRLLTFNIKEKYIKEITNDIKEQIYAVLYHWNDVVFRNALLVLGLEEGKFYEPEADLNIKCFVVVAIRNSLLEVVFSVESGLMKLDKCIPEANMRLITSEAINYFKDIDFEKLGREVEKEKIKDKYQEIAQKYPMAWEALKQLGNSIGKKAMYNKVEVKDKIKISDLGQGYKIKEDTDKRWVKDVQSGINESFSDELLDYLNDIIKSEEISVFYVDCFKMITRNFEKLLKIMEILLENNKMILTSNYLITDSYIGKRTKVYRAAHGNKDMMRKMDDMDFLSGVSKLHGAILKGYVESIKKENDIIKGDKQ